MPLLNSLFRAFFHILLIAGMNGLSVSTLFAQELPPMEQRQVQLRIYGKDAKPLSQKKDDCRIVSISRTNTHSSSGAPPFQEPAFTNKLPADLARPQKNNTGSWIGQEIYKSWWGWWWDDDAVQIVVTDQSVDYEKFILKLATDSDSMQVHFRNGFDSLPFLPGTYHIPAHMGPMFELELPPGFSLTGRDLQYFRTDAPKPRYPQPDVILDEPVHTLPAHKRKGFPGQTTNEFALAEPMWQKSGGLTLWFCTEDGRLVTTSVANLPDMMRGQGPTEHGPRLDNRVPVIFNNREKGQFTVLWINFWGECELDTLLSNLKIVEMAFANRFNWFAAGKNPDGTWSLYATTDEGKTWEERVSHAEGEVSSLDAYDSGEVAVELYKKGSFQQQVEYYLSEDGGRTWKKQPQGITPKAPITLKQTAPVIPPDQLPVYRFPYLGMDHGYVNTDALAMQQLHAGDSVTALVWPGFILFSTDGRKTWAYFPLSASEESSGFPRNISDFSNRGVFNAHFLSEHILIIEQYPKTYIITLP